MPSAGRTKRSSPRGHRRSEDALSAEDVLRFVNLVCSGVTAGVLVAVLVAIIPLFHSLGAEAITVKRTIDPLIDRVNPPATVLAIVSAILILVLADGLSTAAVVFTALGLAGSAGIAVISLSVNMRINRAMRAWSSENPPPSYAETQRRWNRFHALRTASGLVAFVAYVIAVLA